MEMQAASNLVLNPAEIDAGPVLARCALHLRDSRGMLPPFPVEVLGSVKPSVVAEPSVVLLGARPSGMDVRLRSACNRPFRIITVHANEGIHVNFAMADVVALEHAAEVTSVGTDESLSLHPLVIEVAIQGYAPLEEVALFVQRPTKWSTKSIAVTP